MIVLYCTLGLKQIESRSDLGKYGTFNQQSYSSFFLHSKFLATIIFIVSAADNEIELTSGSKAFDVLMYGEKRPLAAVVVTCMSCKHLTGCLHHGEPWQTLRQAKKKKKKTGHKKEKRIKR